VPVLGMDGSSSIKKRNFFQTPVTKRQIARS
jgi:hypothetical protein